MAAKAEPKTKERVAIAPPNFKELTLQIVGTSHYVQHKFSTKAREQIKATQEAGSVAKSKKVREARDFEADCEAAKHKTAEGWAGIPATSFRNAMISACRTVSYKMTHAKLAVHVYEDGYDAEDNTPLVKITHGDPKMHIAPARNDNGSIDLRARPMWDPGWKATVRLRYDADMFSESDVINLMMRVGCQVGIGEGRPDSRNSAGLGWGLFDLVK